MIAGVVRTGIVSDRFLLVFATVMGVTAAQTPDASAQNTRTVAPIATANIQGVVIDFMTAQPLRGASVSLHEIAGPDSQGKVRAPVDTTTDEQGEFVFEDVLTGRFRLFARRSGYVSAEYGAR